MPEPKGFFASIQFQNLHVAWKAEDGWSLAGLSSFVIWLTIGNALAQVPVAPVPSTTTLKQVGATENAVEKNDTQTEIGKPDAPPNPISGQVLEADGKPAAFAKVLIRGHEKYDVDATFPTDENGRFEFVLRIPSNALPHLRVWAENQDGSKHGFHRFAWEEKERTTKDIPIQLQTLRTVNVEVVDQNEMPIEKANVAFQLEYPNTSIGSATDLSGKATARIPESERVQAVVAWKDNLGLDYRLYTLNRYQKADVKAVAPEFPKDGPEKLVLDGAAPITVKVIEDLDRPIGKVSLYPWLLNKEGDSDGLNLSFLSEIFSQVTSPDGQTTFQWMPKWQKQITTFWPRIDGYESPRGNYDPSKGAGALTIKIHRLVPIRGQVLDTQGKPAADIEVAAEGAGRSHNSFRGSVRSDAAGRYELLVAPNQIYIVVLKDKQLVAAPQTGFAALPNQPIEGRDFRLRYPTQVHGRLLNEKTQEPIPNERVIVYQYGTGLHAMNKLDLPNPDNERWSVQPIVQYYAMTDEIGQFEFLLGDGDFDIRPPQQEKAEKFKIAGEPAIGFTVLTKIQRKVELVGLVVREEDAQPVSRAKVTGVPRSFSSMVWQAETGSDGKFTVRRQEEPTYVHTISADQRLAAITKVDELKRAFLVEMQTVGDAKGRMVNEAKQPVAGQQIDYGVKVPDVLNGSWSTRFGGRVVTDKDGQFDLKALVPGWEYDLLLPHTPDGRIPNLGRLTVSPGEHKVLGEFSIQNKP